MWRTTLRSLLAHKVRLGLTTLAVVLGVGFVAGTLVLTDTLDQTFDTLFREVNRGVTVEVRSPSDLRDFHGNEDRGAVPEALLPAVGAVPGVAAAEGTVQGYAQLVDPRSGKAISNGQAPTLGVSWLRDRAMSSLRPERGRGPERAGEIAIDAATARRHGLEVGHSVTVLLQGAPRTERIVGILRFGSADNLAGATLTAFDTATAQRVLRRPGEFERIVVRAEPGVSAALLRERVARAVGSGYEVVTGEQSGAEAAAGIGDALGFFNTALLVFAGIAVFVGGFIILNTFSILVAQRSRELALLRALGASRRQVLGSVLGEAALVGIVASVVGMGLGLLTAAGLKAMLAAFGVELPARGLVFRPTTALWSLVVGVGVTVPAALVPARRASRIPPVAAMRDTPPPIRSVHRRAVAGGALTATGFGVLALGLFGGVPEAAAVVGAGAMTTFLGVTTLGPAVARPAARLIGAPLPRLAAQFRRTAGLAKAADIGHRNAMRNPRRTASTAAALMVGLALVSTVAVLAASIKQSTAELVDTTIGADLVVTTERFQPISAAVGERVRRLPEVGAVATLRFGVAEVRGERSQLVGADPAELASVVRIRMRAGSLDALGAGVLLSADKAAEVGAAVGDSLAVRFGAGGIRPLRVNGIYEDNQFLGTLVVATETYDANFARRLDGVVLVEGASGVPPAALRTAVERVAAGFPNVRVRDQSQLKRDQQQQVDQLLGLITALLLLSVVIAVIGIVNTLALSVFERTRELGLLRAVGMTRRQVRAMIRVESVIIALFGAGLGLAVGTLFGWALVRAFREEGITRLVIPVGRLAGYVLLAAVFGVVAAIWPARRAARLDVLHAIAYE